MQSCFAGGFDMMSHDGICQIMCPEIEDRAIIDAPSWHLLIDPIRWGALHILQHHRAKIKIAVFLILLLL